MASTGATSVNQLNRKLLSMMAGGAESDRREWRDGAGEAGFSSTSGGPGTSGGGESAGGGPAGTGERESTGGGQARRALLQTATTPQTFAASAQTHMGSSATYQGSLSPTNPNFGADVKSVVSTVDPIVSLLIGPGWWRGVASMVIGIRECNNPDACEGGRVAGEYCAEGATGPLCDLCLPNWYPDANSGMCTECDGGGGLGSIGALFTSTPAIALYVLVR